MFGQGAASVYRLATLLFGIGWLFVIFMKSEIPADPGDGIQHFFYSQASWQEPTFFLHHWGKPFFILLSSPFAQLGFNGMFFFNVLVFILSVLIGYKIMDRFKVDRTIQAVFPLLLLVAKDYSLTVFGGMTEVLFNLAVLTSAWLFLEKRFILFAVVVSFMPYMRSEGQLAMILALLLLVYVRHWRSVPFLLSGHLLYSIPGWIVYGDPMWYFTESPYAMEKGIYSSGSWDHYLLSYRNYIDNAGLLVFVIGTVALVYLWRMKKLTKELVLLGFFSYALFFGIVTVHSIMWAYGQGISLGLTRLATQGMPLFLLVNLILISQLPDKVGTARKVSFALLSLAIAATLLTTKKFPIQPTDLERTIISAASSKELEYDTSRYFHYHPLFAFERGDNPVINGSRAVFFHSFDLEEELRTVFQPGDLIVWDSHFGPAEMNISLASLEHSDRLEKIAAFESSQLKTQTGKEPGMVVVFRVLDQR